MSFYSQCGQDEFVFNILKQKNDGFFIDIGANHSTYINNTYFLETIGWQGISIDKEYFDYKERKCKFIQTDVVTTNMLDLFLINNVPTIVDYLSLDTDDFSADCLVNLPHDKYKFKVITIEHDLYRIGDSLRNKERKILNNLGYFLICGDVAWGPVKIGQYYEDWWVNLEYINKDEIENLICSEEYYVEIIKKFNKSF